MVMIDLDLVECRHGTLILFQLGSIKTASVVNGIIAILTFMGTVLHKSSCNRDALYSLHASVVLRGLPQNFFLVELACLEVGDFLLALFFPLPLVGMRCDVFITVLAVEGDPNDDLVAADTAFLFFFPGSSMVTVNNFERAGNDFS